MEADYSLLIANLVKRMDKLEANQTKTEQTLDKLIIIVERTLKQIIRGLKFTVGAA